MAPSTIEPAVSITVPAQYVEEFRCGLVEEIKLSTNWFQDTHDEMLRRGDNDCRDRDGSLCELRRDAEVLLQLPMGSSEDVSIDGTLSLLHVIEQMARKWSEELCAQLSFGPANFEAAASLLERIQWAADQAMAIRGVA